MCGISSGEDTQPGPAMERGTWGTVNCHFAKLAFFFLFFFQLFDFSAPTVRGSHEARSSKGQKCLGRLSCVPLRHDTCGKAQMCKA